MWWVDAVAGLWLFALGTVVGSFLNVCIYRIPWQKSVVWPGSHCPKCFSAIGARDNIPLLSWALLGGGCRNCGLPISPRYPLIEATVGFLFAGLYALDAVFPAAPWFAGTSPYMMVAYHALFVSLLMVATFIDYDLQIIPDAVTVTGMIVGLAFGTLMPEVRLDPWKANPAPVLSHQQGFLIGIYGLIVGGGLVWSIRLVAGLILRREAMGFGDVTLLAMIGSFLGWQAAVLAFFLAPFFGLAHALGKAIRSLAKWLSGKPLSGRDHEIPFGPYLSMAAVTLVFGWPWIWWGWGRGLFQMLSLIFG